MTNFLLEGIDSCGAPLCGARVDIDYSYEPDALPALASASTTAPLRTHGCSAHAHNALIAATHGQALRASLAPGVLAP